MSCALTTANILLGVALTLCLLAYVAPFWIVFPTGSPPMSFASMYRSGMFDIGRSFWAAGLWGACDWIDESLHCTWFLANDFYTQKNLPGWHSATQGIFGAGLVLLTISCFLASCNICCGCCKSSVTIGSVVGSFVVTASVCFGIAIGIYGGFMARDYDVSFKLYSLSFYWGFFVAIIGAVMSLVSSILFFCDSCCCQL